MPSFDPPARVSTGRRSADKREHDRAVELWKQEWSAWLALPPGPDEQEAAATVAAVLAAGVSPSVLHGIGQIHAHRSTGGVLLLGAAGAGFPADHTTERFGRMIGQALQGRRWRLVECGCPASREEAA